MAPTDKAAARVQKIVAQMTEIAGHVLYVGVVGAAAAEQHRGDAPGVTVADVAKRNYFGAPGVPARPWLAVAAKTKVGGISTVSQRAVTAVERGKKTPRAALELLGAYVVGQVQEVISDGVPPPNAASTIAAKGSSKTLIDTGHLRQSQTYEVRKR